MSPREQEVAANPGRGGDGNPAGPKPTSARSSHHPKSQFRQFYIFLIAADLVVLFIYLFLVPTDTWESYNGRLRSLGSLIVSILAYLGLNAVLQRYVTKFTFLDQIWFRATVLFVTPILWCAILPVWSVHLVIRPRQIVQPEVQILTQSSDKNTGQGGVYRYCEVPPSKTSPTSDETICAFGQLLLRHYEIVLKGAPHSTYLPAPSIFVNTFIQHPFPVQLPCRLQLYPVYPKESIYTKRLGEKEEGPEPLPHDGVIWLMPGRYEYIRATDDKRHGQGSLEMPCRADYSLEITLE